MCPFQCWSNEEMFQWSRLENEHLNNAGHFRAVKTVPLPFHEVDEEDWCQLVTVAYGILFGIINVFRTNTPERNLLLSTHPTNPSWCKNTSTFFILFIVCWEQGSYLYTKFLFNNEEKCNAKSAIVLLLSWRLDRLVTHFCFSLLLTFCPAFLLTQQQHHHQQKDVLPCLK